MPESLLFKKILFKEEYVLKHETITSRNNPKIKLAAKLGDKKFRSENSLFSFEGFKLLYEFLDSGLKPELLFVTPDAAAVIEKQRPECDFTVVTEDVYKKISLEKSPEGVFCISKTLDKIHNIIIIYRRDYFRNSSCLLLDGINDPGNLGTILRSASAFGTDTVILSKNCADVYNSKTVRASMGAVFRQKTLRAENLADVVTLLRENRIKVYAAALSKDAIPAEALDFRENLCFVVGSEANGISEKVLQACNASIIIGMENTTESLNAATAASILLYEKYKSNR